MNVLDACKQGATLLLSRFSLTSLAPRNCYGKKSAVGFMGLASIVISGHFNLEIGLEMNDDILKGLEIKDDILRLRNCSGY